MLRMLTAGESHGPALTVILDGMVAGVEVEAKDVSRELERRRHGYGRGTRMKLEADRLEILGGVRHGLTTGAPLSMVIHNSEWSKWQSIMSVGAEGAEHDDPPLTRPRPGHADLAGMLKYGFDEVRPILERASARETAARVAAGWACRSFLRALGIEVVSHVTEIGGIAVAPGIVPGPTDLEQVDSTDLRCLDPVATAKMIALIDECRREGDTLGGVVEVIAYGVPMGLGSHVQHDRRLDVSIAAAMMSIQAIKGVEIGPAFDVARSRGSSAHDDIAWTSSDGFVRATDRAGGTEGGMSTGQPIIARAAMKPLSSLARSLPTVDIRTREEAPAITQRSDVCAVPAAGVVAESMMAYVLSGAVLDKFGGDSVRETAANMKTYRDSIDAR